MAKRVKKSHMGPKEFARSKDHESPSGKLDDVGSCFFMLRMSPFCFVQLNTKYTADPVARLLRDEKGFNPFKSTLYSQN